MSKAEEITEFRRNVQQLIDEGEKKGWVEKETKLANPTFRQILEWGYGVEGIPMRSSTLGKIQDFNKRFAIGDLHKSPVNGRKPDKVTGSVDLSAPGGDWTAKVDMLNHQYVPQAEDLSPSIDKAITLLNRACKEKGISCKVILEAV